MPAAQLYAGSLTSDAAVAGVAAALGGCGTVMAALALLAQNPTAAAVGGAVAAAGLAVLLAASWLDGLLLVAITLPLPALYSSADLRIAAALPVTLVVVLAWCLRRAVSRERLSFGALPQRAIAALLASFLLAAAFAQNHLLAARELVNVAVLFGLLFVAAAAFERRPSSRWRIAAALTAVAAVCGVLAILESAGAIAGAFPHRGTRFHRAALGFGQPNALGLFFALVLPFAVHALTASRTGLRRAAASLALLLITIGLFATFSRGSWVAVLLGALPLWFTGRRRSVVRTWGAGLVAALFIDVATGGAIRDTIARTASDWSVFQRIALMQTGVLTFLAHPIVGVGPGGFVEAIEQFGLLVTGLDDWQPTPHNAYIQMAAEAGIIGLLAFGIFLTAVLRTLVRGVHDARNAGRSDEYDFRCAVLWSFGVLCVAALLDWPFPHGTGQVAMLVIAMGCAGRHARTA